MRMDDKISLMQKNGGIEKTLKPLDIPVPGNGVEKLILSMKSVLL
jgi:hypothetical protein